MGLKSLQSLFSLKVKKKYLENGGAESELLPTASLQKCSQWLELARDRSGHVSHMDDRNTSTTAISGSWKLGVEVGVERKHCKVGCRCPSCIPRTGPKVTLPTFPHLIVLLQCLKAAEDGLGSLGSCDPHGRCA